MTYPTRICLQEYINPATGSSFEVWQETSGEIVPYLDGTPLMDNVVKTNAPFLKLTPQEVGLLVLIPGAFEHIGNSLQYTQLAKRRGVVLSQDVITTTTTIGNSITESGSIITAQHGANYLEVGKSEEIVLRGTIQQANAGGGVLQIRVKYAGITLLTTSSASATIAAGTPFEFTLTTTVRSVGASGTMQINGVLWIDGVSNVADAQTLATINTTTAQNTEVTLKWTVANASNTVSVHQGRILCIEPSK